MSFLKNLFAGKVEETTVDFDTYASLPIYQMLNEDAPFSDWRPSDVDIPDDLEDFFKIYTWMYQMYMFFMLTAQKYGYDIANRALTLQKERLSKGSEYLAAQLGAGLSEIHEIIARQTTDETKIVEVEGKNVEVPVEYVLAVELLVTSDESPFHATKEDIENDDPLEFNDADFALARCLAHGKDSAMAGFEPLIKNVRLVL